MRLQPLCCLQRGICPSDPWTTDERASLWEVLKCRGQLTARSETICNLFLLLQIIQKIHVEYSTYLIVINKLHHAHKLRIFETETKKWIVRLNTTSIITRKKQHSSKHNTELFLMFSYVWYSSLRWLETDIHAWWKTNIHRWLKTDIHAWENIKQIHRDVSIRVLFSPRNVWININTE